MSTISATAVSATASATATATAATTAQSLDLVITAGLVHTMVAGAAPVTAIGIVDGMIAVTGTADEATEWSARERLDFGNAVLVPGLTDGHSHPIMGTDMTAGVDLSEVHTIEDARAALAEAAALLTRGDWQLAWGLDLNVFGDQPARGDLFDSVLGGLPLFIRLFDGHSALANPAALRLSGVTGREVFTQASVVTVDADGMPTGLLEEFAAMELVQRHLPEVTAEQFGERLRQNLLAMSETGLTGAHAMDFIGEPIDMLNGIEASGELPLRLRFSPWCNPGVTETTREALLALQGVGGRRWAVDGVKMFIDGTIDGGTAWLSVPDSRGQSTASFWPNPGDYTAALRWFDDHNIPTATHAIGDAGLTHVLDSLAAIDRRAQHRIEHIETASPEIIGRFAGLGVVASMQPTHCTHYTRADETDNWSVRMGPKRAAHGWPTRDLRNAGALVALGSDWPIAAADPRRIMGASQLRREVGDLHDHPRQPDQAMTALMALEGYTSHAAAAAGETGRAGIVAAGARADFTVLGADPLAVTPDDLAHVPVVATMISGAMQFRGAGYSGAL